MSPSPPQPAILDLRATFKSSLVHDLVTGLTNETRTVPGERDEDQAFAYTRHISTLVLYSDEGLRIYEDITKLDAYYPFNAELEILERDGDEIAARMFGLPASALTDAYLENLDGVSRESEKGGSNGSEQDPSPAASAAAPKERWGSKSVGSYNNGVNGGLSGGGLATSTLETTAVAVELGSGSLEKTRHLLRSLCKLLQPAHEGSPAPFTSIEYKALDLEHSSLVSTLGKLVEQEADYVTASHDGTRRVVASGIAATYDSGLAHLKTKPKVNGHANGSTPAAPMPKKSLLWLGSSIGNFDRPAAASFLKNMGLDHGDSILIGIDNCSDAAMICNGYDDPQGVTRKFIFEGVDHAGRTLHGTEAESALHSRNFEYVSRWNEVLGRHEAYLRCKVEGLTIPLPAVEGSPAQSVVLKLNELIAIEVSYKFTQIEAQAVFDAAGLRLVQQWSDSRSLHSIYLLEKSTFNFESCLPLVEIPKEVTKNPLGLPSLDEWEMLWKTWDAVTLEMIPGEMLMQKPIPLRHIPLFYLGHIPAFLDIHISRHLDLPLTSPVSFATTFERGIDPDVTDPTKITHWHSEVPTANEWPALEEILGYEGRVRDRVRGIVSDYTGERMTRGLARVLCMLYEHEAMHLETLIYITLQAAPQLQPIKHWRAPDFASLSRSWDSHVQPQSLVSYGTTTIAIGHDDDDRLDPSTAYDPAHEYGWDVESPRREIAVEGFKISALPISNEDFRLHLIAHPEEKDLFPMAWSRSKEGSLEREDLKVKTVHGEVPFEYCRLWAVTGSAEQLLSFATAKGGRLPTHPEMMVFLRDNPVDSPSGNVGFTSFHPVPPTPPTQQRNGKVGYGSDGGVWMWTSTVLDAHSGYSPSTLYPGYSLDFHDGQHNIIVGGSYATIPRIGRPAFVNWYQAKYPYVLAGARVTYSA